MYSPPFVYLTGRGVVEDPDVRYVLSPLDPSGIAKIKKIKLF